MRAKKLVSKVCSVCAKEFLGRSRTKTCSKVCITTLREKTKAITIASRTDRRCVGCSERKPLNHFFSFDGNKLSSYCKTCCPFFQDAFERSNKNLTTRKRGRHLANADGRLRLHALNTRYGKEIVARFITRLQEVGNACEICGTTERISLDHCHKMNKFRGVLCVSCNGALGLFKDDPIRLRAATNYLETSR